MVSFEKARHISKCLELAILLEVSTSKPGNVNLAVGFEGTRVEHFLASAVAAAPTFEEAAKTGIAISNGNLGLGDVNVGQLIKDCEAEIDSWQRGGNTLLGTVILLVPLAVASGMTPQKGNFEFDFLALRTNLKSVVESTTPIDAVRLYEAISIAKPGGLNESNDLDVKDPESKERLINEKISLYQVFKTAAGYDDVCYEWANNYSISFDLAFPFLIKQLENKALSTAIIHTFLKVLSERPDTFIARKAGVKKAREISGDAMAVLELGGVETVRGRESIGVFDAKLREADSLYNPGTTADLTAAALALCLLSGYRP